VTDALVASALGFTLGFLFAYALELVRGRP
jgi:hypothetical protein